ncbi:hypothetical protein BDZ91DRAFT_178277 [Kalaharituber pfeilii]|nr:hypothetical protein BDZ91DRAFT_178277 [Kalaharituber pfeilii]
MFDNEGSSQNAMSQYGDVSKKAESSLDEERLVWSENIRRELEAKYDAAGRGVHVDEDTVLRYWEDLCREDAARRLEREIKNDSPEELDARIFVEGILLGAAPAGHSLRPLLLFLLSENLGRRSRYGGPQRDEDLNRAIELAEEGLSLYRKNPQIPQLSSSLAPPTIAESRVVSYGMIGLLNLGALLHERYESHKERDDLEKAIAHTREALELVGDNAVYVKRRLAALHNLSLLLELRYYWTGDRDDLNNAFGTAREALVLATKSRIPSEQLAEFQYLLGIQLEARFQQTGDLSSLSMAIHLARAAVKRTSGLPKKQATYHQRLGSMLNLRYTITGMANDAEEAIMCARRSIKAGVSVQSNYSLLAGLYEAKYHMDGNPRDLDESLTCRHLALELMPKADANGVPDLTALVTALRSQYVGIGGLEDLNRSIDILQGMLTARADKMDRREHTNVTSSLGIMYEARYDCTGSSDDLNNAIALAEATISNVSHDSPDLIQFQGQLAFRLQRRFRLNNDINDIESAIAWGSQALSFTPETCLYRPNLLYSLSRSLALLYLHNKDPIELDFALSIGSEAAEEFPESNPDFSPAMIHLGDLLMMACDREPNQEEKSTWVYWALQFFMTALQCWSATPRYRLEAAQKAAKLHMALAGIIHNVVGELGEPPERVAEHRQIAYEILAEAVGLFPLLTARVLTEDERHRDTTSLRLSLASNAAAMAIKSGKNAYEAARLLEIERGIVMGSLQSLWQDISTLEKAYPALARKFDRLQKKIAETAVASAAVGVDGVNPGDGSGGVSGSGLGEVPTPGGGPVGSMFVHNLKEHRMRDIRMLEGTLRKIQEKPRFESFLSPTEMDLRNAAIEGPIVAVNVTEAGSDAVIIQANGITSVGLDIENTWVEKWIGGWEREVVGVEGKQRREGSVRMVLKGLWEKVVRPVLKAVGFYKEGMVQGTLPRIWWIGIGVMAKAPLHAAGAYDAEGGGECTARYCVSSYTLTVNALVHSRLRAGESVAEGKVPKAVFITMPEISGSPPLTGAQHVDAIVSLLRSDGLDAVVLHKPDVETAVNTIRSANIIYFACYCTTDSEDPRRTGVLLRDQEGGLEVLTVKKLLEARHGKGGLLCFPVVQSVDGGLDVGNVVGVLQVGAGVTGVVGTMWGGNEGDEEGVGMNVWREFYRCLGRSVGAEKGRGAKALREAVENVKKGSIGRAKMVGEWARFAYWGA